MRRPKLRIASAGSQHALHYDESHTLLVQLAGSKIITIVPSSQLDFLYPYPSTDILYRRARVDVENPDLIKFPNARLLTPFNISLGPGDLLFMPQHTGHGVRVVSNSTSLSFRLDFGKT